VLRSPLPLVPDSRLPGVSVQFPHPVPLSLALVPSAFSPEARGSRFSPRTQRGGTLRPSCLAHRRPPSNIPVRCGPADRPLGGRPSYGQHSWYHTGMDVSDSPPRITRGSQRTVVSREHYCTDRLAPGPDYSISLIWAQLSPFPPHLNGTRTCLREGAVQIIWAPMFPARMHG